MPCKVRKKTPPKEYSKDEYIAQYQWYYKRLKKNLVSGVEPANIPAKTK